MPDLQLLFLTDPRCDGAQDHVCSVQEIKRKKDYKTRILRQIIQDWAQFLSNITYYSTLHLDASNVVKE